MILECLVVTGLCGIALVSLYQLTAFLSMHVLVTLFMVMLIAVLQILEGFQMSIRIVLTVLALAVIVTLPWCDDPVGLRLGTFGLNALLIYGDAPVTKQDTPSGRMTMLYVQQKLTGKTLPVRRTNEKIDRSDKRTACSVGQVP